VLLVLAWRGAEHAFLVCFIVALTSDIADGQIARRFNLATPLGAKLDSWADFATYLSVPLATWWLRPDLVATLRVSFVLTLACYLLPIAIGFVKFRGLTSYHTTLARVSAYLIGASAIVLFARGPVLPFQLSVAVLVIAEIEEIAITLVLPRPHSNVRSLGRALELRRGHGSNDRA
jgi:CDP-diacylglycerol--glycerol-3-phosphate 3-phosphatidyltransferase